MIIATDVGLSCGAFNMTDDFEVWMSESSMTIIVHFEVLKSGSSTITRDVEDLTLGSSTVTIRQSAYTIKF